MLYVEHKKIFIKKVEFVLPRDIGGPVNRSLQPTKHTHKCRVFYPYRVHKIKALQISAIGPAAKANKKIKKFLIFLIIG